MSTAAPWRAFAALLLGLVVVPTLGAQTYYKWKDANGATHYSDTPPPKGPASAVQVRASQEVAAAVEPAPASTAGKATVAGDSPELRAAEAKYRQQACSAAQADVAAAQGTAMLVNAKDLTSARQLSADERAAALLAAKGRVQQFCKAGADKP